MYCFAIPSECLLFIYFRKRARELRLDRVLMYIRDNAADRDAWDMADQGETDQFVLCLLNQKLNA